MGHVLSVANREQSRANPPEITTETAPNITSPVQRHWDTNKPRFTDRGKPNRKSAAYHVRRHQRKATRAHQDNLRGERDRSKPAERRDVLRDHWHRFAPFLDHHKPPQRRVCTQHGTTLFHLRSIQHSGATRKGTRQIRGSEPKRPRRWRINDINPRPLGDLPSSDAPQHNVARYHQSCIPLHFSRPATLLPTLSPHHLPLSRRLRLPTLLRSHFPSPLPPKRYRLGLPLSPRSFRHAHVLL